jgi:Ca2+-binding RTX toxin-like protein
MTDTISGTNSHDFLAGDSGPNTLDGGDGNDTLLGGQGNDVLLGGSGDDSLLGGTTDASPYDSSGDDTLIGGTGNDVIVPGNGNDTVRFNLGDGRDTLVAAYQGNGLAMIELGQGITKEMMTVGPRQHAVHDLQGYVTGGNVEVRFSESDAITLQNVTGWSSSTFRFANGDTLSGGNILYLANQQPLTGTTGNDYLLGDLLADHIVGGNGNDTLIGDLGDDTLEGGAGNDYLDGNSVGRVDPSGSQSATSTWTAAATPTCSIRALGKTPSPSPFLAPQAHGQAARTPSSLGQASSQIRSN